MREKGCWLGWGRWHVVSGIEIGVGNFGAEEKSIQISGEKYWSVYSAINLALKLD